MNFLTLNCRYNLTAGKYSSSVFLVLFLFVISNCSRHSDNKLQNLKAIKIIEQVPVVVPTTKEGDAQGLLPNPHATEFPPKPKVDTPLTPVTGVKVATDLEALTFFQQKCAGCHGSNLPKETDRRSFWPMPTEFDLPLVKDGPNNDFQEAIQDSKFISSVKTKIEIDQFSLSVYQAISHKSLNIQNKSPMAMPPTSLTESDLVTLKSVLAWFELNFPLVVADAIRKYSPGKTITQQDFLFQCASPYNIRSFVNKLTQEALGRPPTQTEISSFGDPNSLVNKDTKTKVEQKLKGVWRNEFREYALKNLAEKYINADSIRNSQLVANVQKKEDIALEFYAKILHYTNLGLSFEKVILDNKVLATENTAAIYECNLIGRNPVLFMNSKNWYECPLLPPRETFFSTLGFLLSKPTSFLQENNNYGRVAAINEVVFGDTLTANTQGATGEPAPMASCFKSKDYRALDQGNNNYAPRGTLKIAAEGALCQSCHVDRHLAAGSLVFRPFASTGEILTRELLLDNSKRELIPGLATEWRNALPNENYKWMVKKSKLSDDEDPPSSVDGPFLVSLLDIGKISTQESACIVDKSTPNTQVPVTTVGELIKYMISDPITLTRGLSKLVPRSVTNVSGTNLEIFFSIFNAWNSKNGSLEEMLISYFTTETYSCDGKK